MTTPFGGMEPPRHALPVQAARWREVDAILQAALASPPAERHALVARACAGDEALRTEVLSLLAADRGDDDFLERPAAATLRPVVDRLLDDEYVRERHGAERPTERTITARAALYACMATLAIGVVGGLFVGRAPSTPAGGQVPTIVATPDAGAGGEATLAVVDRYGHPLVGIVANRPWTPRFSPDGQRVAYGAFGAGRHTSDLFITDLATRSTRRLTDDDADANDPQWSPDGATLAYSAGESGGKDVMLDAIASNTRRRVASRAGTQFPSDWARDGRALLVTEEAGENAHDILVQPTDGSAARRYSASRADETAARLSPDGRWVAYTSNASGRPEVYLNSYPQPGQRVRLSRDGGAHPVWRGDGRELYYWHDGALMALRLEVPLGDALPAAGAVTELFRAPYEVGVSTMYDVSPDGERFVIARPRH